MVKTKIIATLGPASNNHPTLRKMMLSGLDVVRINFSHGNTAARVKALSLINNLNKKYRRNIKLLGDLEGYRIRIGKLKKPFEIKKRQVIYLTQERVLGEFPTISFDYLEDLKHIKKGAYIYIDDGRLALVVEGHQGNRLKTKVIVGGTLKEHKGINIPGIKLSFQDLTDKDKQDIQFCISHGFNYIAQSFVRDKEDILRIKGKHKGKYKLIAKIENREGINNVDEIIEVSDGIMIARGDMGVCIPIYEVPMVQKEIIHKCNKAGRFAITATQMLESMTENLKPTRAEVSDVANAIIDGSDYLMLSAETSVGLYPSQAVEMMNRIIKFTEGHLLKH
jgi:pyruvate kinase